MSSSKNTNFLPKNQIILLLSKIKELEKESNNVCIEHKEGFTSFSIINGDVYVNGRPLNGKEILYGTIIPKVPKEQIKIILELAKEIQENEDLREKEIFLLVANKYSTWIEDSEEKIYVLGYFLNNKFIFAYEDENLEKFNHIPKEKSIQEAFKKSGRIVVPNEQGQPTTYILEDSNYHKFINLLDIFLKNMEKNSSFGKYKPTDIQKFVFSLSFYDTNSSDSIPEQFLQLMGNNNKRNNFQKIKLNFYNFYNLFYDIIYQKNNKIFINSDPNSKYDKISETWKKCFGAFKREKSDDNKDIFKLTVLNNLILFSKLFNSFDQNKHKIQINTSPSVSSTSQPRSFNAPNVKFDSTNEDSFPTLGVINSSPKTDSLK